MSFLAVGLAVSAVSTIGSMMGSISGRKAAERRAKEYEEKLSDLEENRQEVINPYSDVTNTFSEITNPYENLQVSTASADYQAEESDIALANTLDILKSSGTGGGGATALATAALRSKQGIAASIEEQEVNNNKLKADGQARKEQLIAEGEARREELDAKGRMFEFNANESRENDLLDRYSSIADQERNNAAAYKQQTINSLASFGSNAGSTLAGIHAGKNS